MTTASSQREVARTHPRGMRAWLFLWLLGLGFAPTIAKANVAAEEPVMQLMRAVRDADDPAEALRNLRRWQQGARVDAKAARKYALRFLRKDGDLALAAQAAALGPREEQPADLAELVRLSTHARPAIRETALWVLGTQRNESEQALAALEAGMSDESPAVREVACWAAGYLQGEVAFPPWRLAGTPAMASGGIFASGGIAIGGGPGSTRMELFWAATRSMEDARHRSGLWRRALGWSREEDWLPEAREADAIRPGLVTLVPALARSLNDEVPEVADTALWALANAGPHASEHAVELGALLAELDEWRCDLVIAALGRMGQGALAAEEALSAHAGGEQGIPGAFAIGVALHEDERSALLRQALEGDDLLRHAEACYLIARQPNAPEDELLDPLASSFLRSYYHALEPLLRLGPRAVPHLVEALRSDNLDLRGMAACALAEHGGRAEVQVLQRLAKGDADEDVRRAAQEAVKAIEARTD